MWSAGFQAIVQEATSNTRPVQATLKIYCSTSINFIIFDQS